MKTEKETQRDREAMAAAEESFVERGLFGGAITCCIPANFYVSFPSLSLHPPSLLFLVVPSLLVRCDARHLFFCLSCAPLKGTRRGWAL